MQEQWKKEEMEMNVQKRKKMESREEENKTEEEEKYEGLGQNSPGARVAISTKI